MFIGSYLVYLGMLLFSFSMEKHYKLVFTTNINKKIKVLAKIAGALLLGISLIILIKDIGVSLGITYWIGALSVVAVVIAFMYTYRPNLIIKLSILFLVVSLILIFFIK